MLTHLGRPNHCAGRRLAYKAVAANSRHHPHHSQAHGVRPQSATMRPRFDSSKRMRVHCSRVQTCSSTHTCTHTHTGQQFVLAKFSSTNSRDVKRKMLELNMLPNQHKNVQGLFSHTPSPASATAPNCLQTAVTARQCLLAPLGKAACTGPI